MRILSLQPSVSLTLQSLGRLDALAGCTRYCLDAIPALRSHGLAVVRDSWSSETDEIVAIKPDLVIASVPYRQESLAAILRAGVPVLALAPHSPGRHIQRYSTDRSHGATSLIAPARWSATCNPR